jgi:Protein of unknown function (DUF2815)
MATKKRVSLKTPEGTACFANVFEARARKDAKGNPKGDPKFSILLVFDRGTDLDEMQDAIEAAAVEKFGSKAVAMLANGKLHNPLREAADYNEHGKPFTNKGAMMAAFKSTDQPGVVDEDAEPLMSKTEFYSGCRARVSYRVYAYDNESKGVGLALVNVQKLGDGERLSGNPSAEDDFADAPKAKAKPARRSRDDDDEDDLL